MNNGQFWVAWGIAKGDQTYRKLSPELVTAQLAIIGNGGGESVDSNG